MLTRKQRMLNLLADFAETYALEPHWWMAYGQPCFAFRTTEQSAVEVLAKLVNYAMLESSMYILSHYLKGVESNVSGVEAVLYFPGLPAPEDVDCFPEEVEYFA